MREDVQILQHRPRVDWHELRNTRLSESILRGEGQQGLTLLILAIVKACGGCRVRVSWS